jgi:hypothetical protein
LRQTPDKQRILDSLAAIARGADRPPSRSEFLSLSGISEHSVLQFFPSWNAALRAAGLQPYTLNLRLEDRELLEDWGHAVRRSHKIPTRRAYRHLGKFDHRTFERRLGPFGMVAKELGYTVEAVQSGFPDCEAKRQIAPHRWQRVHLEFEFESRNFRDHGHSLTGCDVIVCWRHNWPDSPPHLEILELSSLIKSLPTSQA